MKNFDKSKLRKYERGQAIIIIAYLIIPVLLGMAGLAIDGGRQYFMHRDTQNAVDAAILAATYAKCTAGGTFAEVNQSIRNAALNALHSNSFDDGRGGVDTDVMANYDRDTHTNAPYSTNYVKVILRYRQAAAFMQLLGRDELDVTSSAVGRCGPSELQVQNAGLVALSEQCPGLVLTNSNATINTYGATNSDLQVVGSNSQGDDPGISMLGAFYLQRDQSGDAVEWINEPVQIDEPFIDPYVDEIKMEYFREDGYLASLPNYHFHEGFWRVNGNPNNPTEIEDGIHYAPDGISLTNVIINEATLASDGPISFNGNAITASPSPATLDFVPSGLLAFSTAVTNCGQNAIDFSASESTISGLVYAPNGGIQVSNSGNLTIMGCYVGKTIHISGSDLDIICNPGEPLWSAPYIGIAE